MIASTAQTPPTDSPGERLRRECRAMARQRALLAAATSLIPIPGVDLATDLAVMTRLIRRINEEFGLDEAQISRLSDAKQALVYRLLTGAGGTLAARLTTPALLGRIVRLAGIGYWSVKTVTLRHIARCKHLVAELENRRNRP